MGFDNECILNIQSLSGEYFCPVCRLLVYPNEALQSQCTHLYCKPCLKYVVSTTRACPYDGYLVTEADSKPLIESNKTLAETIGMITVHCLYNRSGCPWQGPLSDCTTHCTGCAFGNSPVVCNRCEIQIVHRQVQEHAQNCPGVQAQPQPAEGAQDATITSTTANAARTGTATSQAQTATASVPGKDPNQQVNSTTQAQTAVQAAVPTTEQWYQQYYQQYPGYDPYQQHYQQYYPYQAAAQYQQVSIHTQASQSQLQPQLQHQSQVQFNPQQETNPAVQQQSQIQLQIHPSAHVHSQPNPVPPVLQNVPQYQQPPLQMQPPQPQIQAQPQSQHNPVPQPQPHLQTQHQTLTQHQLQPLPQPLASRPNQPLNPILQPQAQHSSSQAVTGHHSYPQPQIHQQMQLLGPQQPQGGPPPQLQHPVQMQSQFPQQSTLLRPPQPLATIPNQQPGLLPSPGQVPNISPAQPLPVHSLVHQPGLPVHQQPVMQPIQQANQQYLQNQQPFPGQPWGPVQDQGHQQGTYTQQQMHPEAQLRPQGQPQAFHQPSYGYLHPPQNVSISYGAQPHQAQSLAGRPVLPVHGAPVLPVHGAPTQPYANPASGLQVRPMHVGVNQQSGNVLRANNEVRSSSERQSGFTPGPSERQGDMEKGVEADSSAQKIAKRDLNDMDAGIGADAGELRTINSESDLRPVDGKNKPIGEAKDTSELLAAENGEPSIKQVEEDLKQGAGQQNDVSNADHSLSENKNTKDGPLLETPLLQEGEHLEEQKMKLQNDRSPISQGSGRFPSHGHKQSQLASADGQGKQQLPSIHYGPSALQQRPVGPPLLQAPPLAPPHHTHLPGHPPIQQRPLAPGHPPSHYGPCGPEAEMFPNQGPNYTDGRQGIQSHMMGMNMASGPDPDPDRFRPFPDEHLNSFPLDPARRIAYRGEFEEDRKHFPRASSLDIEPVSKFGSHFFSGRPLDRGPHGFGVHGAQKPLDKGSHGLNYDLGLNMEPQDGSAPPRFFPPFHHDRHPHDAEGPIAFHNNTIGRSDFPRTHPGLPVSHVPGYGHRHADNLAARSPGRDYPGMSSRGFGGLPGLDDIHSRESHRFGDPISPSFRDNRFPGFPSRLHRGEIDGPGNLHMGEPLSGEFLGQDGRPSHMRRGDHFGPGSLPRHLRLGEGGFGASSGHLRMGELAGPGNFYHQRFGQPGFRSSFGGSYAGDLESSDNSRKRKSSMGWCRICKVDCETLEGLDLHSQTREHQKMAMDMVITIKKNAKKQKSAPSDNSSLENASKTRNASSEGRGDKH